MRLTAGVGVILAMLTSTGAAQDYRLPQSMKGRPEAAKPDVDYRIPGAETKATRAPVTQLGGPYVKIRDLQCSVGYSNGVATGQVENISKQTLNHVEIAVSWDRVRHAPVALEPMPMKPGDRIPFYSSGTVRQYGTKGCSANVTVR